MLICEKKYIDALNRVLYKTDFLFILKCFRGIGDFQDPWYDYQRMKQSIQSSESDYKNTLLLLHMGIGAAREDIEREIGEDAQALVECGLWRCEEDRIETNNLVVVYYQGIKVVVEINPWYETCTNKNTDVYIGLDSLRLAEHIVFKKGAAVLDLCSGSGIQGLLAAKSAGKVVSVELNGKAVPVTRFNIHLNAMEDVVELRQGDLYSVLREDETFDYIYANPPFIPMLQDTVYPMCGAGGEDGLMVLRGIIGGFKKHLREGGEVIIFCECLGDEKEVFFDREIEALLSERNGRGLSLLLSRLICELQLKKVSSLTTMYDEAFDPEDFERRMSANYKELGAKYLYSIVYKLDMDGSGKGLKHVYQYNPWDLDDHAKLADFEVKENGEVFDLLRGGKRVSQVNAEARALLEALGEGLNVRQAAEKLFPRFDAMKKYRFGYPEFLEKQLSACNKLEGLGVITRE